MGEHWNLQEDIIKQQTNYVYPKLLLKNTKEVILKYTFKANYICKIFFWIDFSFFTNLKVYPN